MKIINDHFLFNHINMSTFITVFFSCKLSPRCVQSACKSFKSVQYSNPFCYCINQFLLLQYFTIFGLCITWTLPASRKCHNNYQFQAEIQQVSSKGALLQYSCPLLFWMYWSFFLDKCKTASNYCFIGKICECFIEILWILKKYSDKYMTDFKYLLFPTLWKTQKWWGIHNIK